MSEAKFEQFEGYLHSGGFPGAFLNAKRVVPTAEALAEHAGSVAFMGVPFDGMCISRTGTNHGPKAIREASEQFSCYNASLGIDLQDSFSLIDCGDALVIPGSAQKTFERFEPTLDAMYRHRILPVVFGGDHSVAIPNVRAFARHHSNPGLILVDSHFDTAEDLGGEPLSHCCPITRAVDAGFDPRKIVIMGINGWMNPRAEEAYAAKHGITVIHLEEIIETGIMAAARKARSIVEAGTDGVYMTFDIDSIDAGAAPGTGVPAVGGLSAREAITLVRELGRAGGGLKGFDLMEVSPSYDHDGITSRLAVCLTLETLGAIAKARR